MNYNLVKIGTVWLTSDGTETGEPCRVEVLGLGRLLLGNLGSVNKAADGTPYLYSVESVGQGTDIQITVTALMAAEVVSLAGVINTALSAETAIEVTVEGLAGDFTLSCLPLLPNPIEIPGSFNNDRIESVVISLTVIEITEEV